MGMLNDEMLLLQDCVMLMSHFIKEITQTSN